MSRLASLLLLAFVVGGTDDFKSDKNGRTPASFRDLFCPECVLFVGDEWSLNSEGHHRLCGRKPVDVEAGLLTWYWCRDYQAWDSQACPRSESRGCCTPYTRTALVRNDDRGTPYRAPYCPLCRFILEAGTPDDSDPNCMTCGRPMVVTGVVTRTWYWCMGDREWLDQPCTMDRTGKCCRVRTVTIPAIELDLKPYYRSEPISYGTAAPVRSSPLLVSTYWLEARLHDSDVVVLHVGFDRGKARRENRTSYAEGHIPFARFVSWEELAVSREGLPNEFPPAKDLVAWARRVGIDWNSRIVLYDTGKGLEASRAFVALDYLGLSGNAALLDGMWKAWVQGMHEVSLARTLPEPSSFVPEFRPEVLVSLREVADISWAAHEYSGRAVLLDARSPEAFVGIVPGKGIPRPGHIPGAVNLPWNRIFKDPDGAMFLRDEELRGVFENVGARPGARLVVYCRTGVKAAPLYFAAKLLGYEVSLYDGSFSEWSRARALPVEMLRFLD